jgi:hypothetical protein
LSTNLHVEDHLELRVQVAVVDLEESVHEFAQVNESLTLQVHNVKEALANDSRQLRVENERDFVDAFGFLFALRNQVPVDVLEVGDRDVFLELLVVDDGLFGELNFFCEDGLSLLHGCILQSVKKFINYTTL